MTRDLGHTMPTMLVEVRGNRLILCGMCVTVFRKDAPDLKVIERDKNVPCFVERTGYTIQSD